MPKRPLPPDDRQRLAMQLDQLGDQLAEVEQELFGAYRYNAQQVKHTRRAVRAVEAASRALDRLG